jgi:dimethylhistidine N-methyltransferase/ergothioneine biosynthesis protein EgtC
MCRFMAYLGAPVTLEDLLLKPQHSLFEQSWAPREQTSGSVNADGFGVGWYCESRDEPARYRRAQPMWTDRSFHSIAGVISSTAVLGVVRDATPPSPSEESCTPPFTSGRWLFAHTGAIERFTCGIGTELRRRVSETRAASIQGTTDTELLFALVLDAMDAGDRPEEALRGVLKDVSQLAPSRLNLVMTDGKSIIASCAGDSLYVSRGGTFDGVLVASEPCTPETEWEKVPEHSLLTVADAEVLIQPLQRSEKRAEADARVSVKVLVGPYDLADALRRDAHRGLTASPKTLPSKWFYDEHGSRLFDAITSLDEYYPTRCERGILTLRADAIARASAADTLVELGSGTSDKTRLLLSALQRAGTLRRFSPFDVSAEVVTEAAHAIAQQYPGLVVEAVVGDFDTHLELLPRGGRRLIAFLGGTIGNFTPIDRSEFLHRIAAGMEPGDSFLLGADLLKDVGRLERAYDDRAGVTAQFNLNILTVLNRELGGEFDLTTFEHVARFDAENGWIEMLLRSRCDQDVKILELGLEIPFVQGEEIRTEISTKFSFDALSAELAEAGLQVAEWWMDPDGDYSLCLSFLD